MKGQEIRRRYFIICLITLIWATLLIQPGAYSQIAEDDSGDTDDVDPAYDADRADADPAGSSAEPGEVSASVPPGEDPRMFYLLAGEQVFRSRELEKARGAFEKVLHLDSQDAQAQYFLGLIEYEEGNLEKARTRFQIAHECLGLSSETAQLPADAKQLQLEFPEGYEARVYYKDGWYMRAKDPATVDKAVHSLQADSTYRIELRPKRGESWVRRSFIGFILALSFVLAR